jgi:hypothetical protein
VGNRERGTPRTSIRQPAIIENRIRNENINEQIIE